MNSITKRWVKGSLFFTLAVVLVAEALFLYYTITGYYNYANSAIIDQFNMVYSQLQMFSSAANDEQALRLIRSVEQFEEKGRFELTLIDADGDIVLSSSGVKPEEQPNAPDIEQALKLDKSGTGYYTGRNSNGERVMAITERTPYSAGGIVAMRISTSLKLVDRTIVNLVLASVLLLFVIIMASVISGVYFIRSIVQPLQKVEVTATKIAGGDFDTRIDIPSDDEIGRLCGTINHMAEELSYSEKMKNEFISSVSHELRTPLTSIKGWIETVGQFENTDEPGFRRGMEIISYETDRLYEMVEELLDFSNLQSGVELKMELQDLAAEVEEAVLLSASRAKMLDIAVHYTAPELPVPVLADRNRLRQVLLNVLDNAIKYSFKDGVINVAVETGARRANVVIQDEGRGISAHDLKNVKQKFYKGKTTVRGSGIGLAVVDEIMRAHDGVLDITSELNHGTTVTLSFPLFKKNQ